MPNFLFVPRWTLCICFLLFFACSGKAQIDTLGAKIELRRWIKGKQDWMNFIDVYPVNHHSELLYLATQTQTVSRIYFEGCKVEIDFRLIRRDYESWDHYDRHEPKANYPPKKIQFQVDLSQIKSLYMKTNPPGNSFLYNGEFVQYLQDVYVLYFFELIDGQETEKQLLIGSHYDPKLKDEPVNRIKDAFDQYIKLCKGYIKRKE